MGLETNKAVSLVAFAGNTNANGETGATNITQNSPDTGAKTEKPWSELDRKYIAWFWGCTPKDVEHTNNGMKYLKKNDYDNAISEFQSALDLMPNKPLYHFNLGLAYDGKGEFGKAIDQFIIVTNSTPKDACGYIALGKAYYKKGEPDNAVKQYNIVINDKNIVKTNDELSQCYAGLDAGIGEFYFKQGKLKLAIEHYQKAINLSLDVPEYHAALGLIYRQKGKLDYAISKYEQAIYYTSDEKKKADYNNIIKNLKLKQQPK